MITRYSGCLSSRGEFFSKDAVMQEIPGPTKRRLVQVFQFLCGWKNSRVTSAEISAFLGCKDSLVRHDFRFVECSHGISNGYDTAALKKAVATACGVQQMDDAVRKKCCIVGLGRLGAALLDNVFFEESGFSVAAGFDSSVNRLEIMRSTFELYPASRIEIVVPQLAIEYALLCCSEKEAPLMTGRLLRAGIKGIVNYTRAVLNVPAEVRVENCSPVTALMNVQAAVVS